VVSFDEIVEAMSRLIGTSPGRRYIYHKYVSRMVEAGKLVGIRRGLYSVLSPLDTPEGHSVDKLLVASKVRPNYYLGFHTALEYYGCASSLINEAYTCVKAEHRFDQFSYGRYMFRPVFVDDTSLGVEEESYLGNVVRVSGRERTLIECIDRVQYAGGWEECVKSLEGLSNVDARKLLEQLRGRKKALVRRVGFIVELLKSRSQFYEHIPVEVLNDLSSRASGSPQYFIEGDKGALNKRWGLYVPEGFEERLRGI